MRVFLATNVIIAAFATRGLCEDVFRVVLTDHKLIVGHTVILEVERILNDKLKMPSYQVGDVTAFIREQAEVITPSMPAPWPAADPDDRWVVAAALDGKVDVLVSGDRDLLALEADIGVPIVSPRGFWEMLA